MRAFRRVSKPSSSSLSSTVFARAALLNVRVSIPVAVRIDASRWAKSSCGSGFEDNRILLVALLLLLLLWWWLLSWLSPSAQLLLPANLFTVLTKLDGSGSSPSALGDVAPLLESNVSD